MFVLGISGGMDRMHETDFARFNKDVHDSSAVLIEDGVVVAAVEEERLDRIKHSNKFPSNAIRFCLQSRGITLAEVDRIALVNTEETVTRYTLWVHFTLRQHHDRLDGRQWVQRQLLAELGEQVPAEKISFVSHHLSHATSAFAGSGFDRALVVTLDGAGDSESGSVRLGDATGLRTLREYTVEQSLGVFYQRMSHYLGFDAFSEFKVMGLAPYGDASRYRRWFEAAHRIEPNGSYRLDVAKMWPLIDAVPPRKPREPVLQQHMDIAAALQEMVEKIVFSVLHHYRRQTGERCLALAGGVGHNCTLNGRLLASGMFEKIFVQPAAHDAGTALGAALAVYGEATRTHVGPPPSGVWWGPAIDDREAERQLDAWSAFVTVEALDEETVIERTADLLAAGKVIGWVQGRSEFGPRALGNRSILADPRPAANRDVVNRMVKKREEFRPFAPAVLEEAVHEYFVVPAGVADLSFMTFVVPVRPEQRARLGAITHVDGTARVQTVSKDRNPRFWQLIDAFGRRTGIPMLLNTSFNNNAEPIVDSVADAVRSFLTTGLDHLVVGTRLVSKRVVDGSALLGLRPELPGWVVLRQDHQLGPDGARELLHTIGRQPAMPAEWADRRRPLSSDAWAVLVEGEPGAALGQRLERLGITDDAAQRVVGELERLWAERYVTLLPV